ncbi:hypothetical protein J3F83DRAFT_760981 [Trichoderma novae-zelandiae]
MTKKTELGIKPQRPQKDNRQSGRSHDENRERAFIAASRRRDRDLDARLKSALDASEIHKKRTGKALRITREIVENEEMYEEEEPELLRRKVLGVPSSTGGSQPDPGKRVCELIASSDQEWRQSAINMLFARSFPKYEQQAHTMNTQTMNTQWYQPQLPMQHSPVPTSDMISSPEVPRHFSLPVISTSHLAERTPSLPVQSPWMDRASHIVPPSPTQAPPPLAMGRTPEGSPEGQTPESAQMHGMMHTSPPPQFMDLYPKSVDSGFNTPSAEILGDFDFSPTTETDKYSSESPISPDDLIYLNPAQLHTLSQVHTCACNPAWNQTCKACKSEWDPLPWD